ncbi:SDR family NAD(P)-dependent oxidoreductase [Kribbella jejuensis]|uniref:3-hydroxybutyrate dehydrogenase/3-oxoacyl-[acyl-carrier protein] reductase n=1 Tax=Kribbella jejuensis TaxID=236068 RepID=A0A542DUS6_9ACTN|nr:SDR family NAD(P)-dependent oxidoreductase [Kribbella jejuensis]TQJ06766.1 3-hydroxybutyrate dehydrogenase/3-oxoacyl-[acyl-carrier protein] reductase [Kribbella jejuensis]
MDISGRTAVVTGAAVGIGRAIAVRLAEAGASVVVADLDAAGGKETCRLIGPTARFVEVDMRDDDAVRDLMACQPQILVNNAGGGAVLKPCFPDAPVARWTASLEVNLRAPMLTTQLALPGMQAAGGGAVINVGSTAGLGFEPHVSPEYSAAKAALIRLTATLAPLHASHGVRVNCVVPDWVATPRGLRERDALPAAERGPELVPLSAVTDAVVDFVSDETAAGRVLLLDRGQQPRFLD